MDSSSDDPTDDIPLADDRVQAWGDAIAADAPQLVQAYERAGRAHLNFPDEIASRKFRDACIAMTEWSDANGFGFEAHRAFTGIIRELAP